MCKKEGRFKVGLIGCGTIGAFLLDKINRELAPEFVVSAVLGRSETSKGKDLTVSYGVDWYTDFDQFLASGLDIVIEAASHEALVKYGAACLSAGIDFIPASVGSLVDEELLQALKLAADAGNAIMHIPSGGIGGIDALQATGFMGITDISMTVRKTPDAWKTVDYVKERGFNLDNLSEPMEIYNGVARNCVREFPQDVNIAAVLSLGGVGFDKTKIKIVADPDISINIYEIDWVGPSGKYHFTFENGFDPSNPKTTYLAMLSILATLTRIRAAYRIGS